MLSLELQSLDSLPIGYIVSDIDRKVVAINYAARELLSAAGEINSLEEVVTHLPERLALLDHVRYCSIEHKSCSFREVDLGARKLRVFLSPVFAQDELRGNLLTLEDITDKVAAEHARDQFLAFLVHELRTPLTAIHGNSQLINEYFKDVASNPDLAEMLGDINSGSEHLLGMVNDFLDMSRMEEGRIEFDMQEFDLVALVADTVRELSVLAAERGLSLSFAAPPEQPILVVADPKRTRQIVTNLVGNGLKFTEKGGVSMSVAVQDKKVEVSVEDTGPGIPPESLSDMFQKYYQASNNPLRKDSAKSTGLGLYVTKLLAKGMGGTIRVAKTELNVGTTFAFTLDLSSPDRLKKLEKQRYDAKQGVEHAQASEHHSMRIGHQ